MADASDSSGGEGADGAEGAEGGGEAGGSGAEGGGEAGGEGAAGGEEAVAQGDGQAGGGQDGSGQPGGGAAGGSGQPGGAAGAGGLDEELMEAVKIFEAGMQQQIIVIASSTPGGDDGMGGTVVEGSSGGSGPTPQGEGPGGGAEGGADQTGESPGIVLVEGDVSQLPQGGNGGTVSGSGVVDPTDEGIPGAPSRKGGSAISRILVKVPDDVGDGSDDDVVARQIREAAMNETDPVLREKLWEEYRAYKKSM